MAEDLKDILSNLNNDVSQETLLKYLNEQLSKEEMHEVEKQLLENEFENDAVEGLQTIDDALRLQYIVESLNRDLKKRTLKKKQSREKYQFKPQWWLYFSILILLIILALIYLFIHSRINN